MIYQKFASPIEAKSTSGVSRLQFGLEVAKNAVALRANGYVKGSSKRDMRLAAWGYSLNVVYFTAALSALPTVSRT